MDLGAAQFGVYGPMGLMAFVAVVSAAWAFRTLLKERARTQQRVDEIQSSADSRVYEAVAAAQERVDDVHQKSQERVDELIDRFRASKDTETEKLAELVSGVLAVLKEVERKIHS